VVKKIKQNEIELRDRNTVLRGTKPNVRRPVLSLSSVYRPRLKFLEQNFSSIRTVYAEKLKKLKDASKPGAAPPVSAPLQGSPSFSDLQFSSPSCYCLVRIQTDPKMQARKARECLASLKRIVFFSPIIVSIINR
jgi:hypothetical protein